MSVLTPLALRAGRVDELLQAYDRERRVLPPPVSVWQWGWTKSAETWNGRIGACRTQPYPTPRCNPKAVSSNGAEAGRGDLERAHRCVRHAVAPAPCSACLVSAERCQLAYGHLPPKLRCMRHGVAQFLLCEHIIHEGP